MNVFILIKRGKMLPLWFAILYPIAYVLFFIVLYNCSKQYPKRKHYSIISRTISGLGNERYKSSKLFREDFFFLPLFNLLLIYFLFLFLSNYNLSVICIYFLAIGEIAAFGISFATENVTNKIKFWLHFIFSSIAFIASIIGFVLLGFSLKSQTSLILYPCFLPLFFGIMAGIAFASNKKHKDDVVMPIMKNICFWEWLTFLSLWLCFAITYLLLLMI